MQTWSVREVGVFLEHVRDDRLAALWRLYALTGCRRGEGVAVTWRVLDLERGAVGITSSLVPVGRELVFVEPKTDAGRRQVALDPTTVQVLRDHRDRQELERHVFADAYTDADLVFCREAGHRSILAGCPGGLGSSRRARACRRSGCTTSATRTRALRSARAYIRR